MHFVGANFDFHLQSGWELYSASYAWTAGGSSGSQCPSVPSAAPSLADSQHLNLPMPGQFCDGAVTVSLSAPLDAGNTGATAPRMKFSLTAPFDIAPKATGMSGSGTAGQNETVSGSGFGSSPGSVSVNGTGASVASWSDGAVTFVIPDAATSGGVQLTRPLDRTTFSAGTLGVTASVSGLSPAKAPVGAAVTLTGSGFGSSSGTLSVNGTAASVSSWSPTSIAFTVPDGATTGPVSVSTNGTSPPANPPALTVVPRITGFTPTHAAPGALIEIDGTTFGTQQGTVTVGGSSAQVTLWGDKQVLAALPGGLPKGTATVTVAPPGTDPASAPFSIDAVTGGSSTSSSSSSGSASATPGFIAPNPSGPVIAHGAVPFFKPAPPPGPVSLRLQSAAEQADPGGSVAFTVTLTAFGKPIAAAPVDLLLVIEPGSDAAVTPSHAVTDANGQVSGVIHLSKTAGDHIVLARSGIYSDEIRVVGRTASNTVAAANQAGNSAPPGSSPPLLAVRSPVLWALLSCLLLFGAGFGLNLMTAPAVGERSGGVRSGLGGSLLGAGAAAGDAVRFAAGVVAVLGAQGLGLLRRGPGGRDQA